MWVAVWIVLEVCVDVGCDVAMLGAVLVVGVAGLLADFRKGRTGSSRSSSPNWRVIGIISLGTGASPRISDSAWDDSFNSSRKRPKFSYRGRKRGKLDWGAHWCIVIGVKDWNTMASLETRKPLITNSQSLVLQNHTTATVYLNPNYFWNEAPHISKYDIIGTQSHLHFGRFVCAKANMGGTLKSCDSDVMLLPLLITDLTQPSSLAPMYVWVVMVMTSQRHSTCHANCRFNTITPGCSHVCD